jgi:hypothetical protein
VADSPSPVGDWITRRYPPKDSTHYFGAVPGDPGCAAVHIPCTYDSGWREGLRTLAADLRDLGEQKAAALADELAEHPGGKL